MSCFHYPHPHGLWRQPASPVYWKKRQRQRMNLNCEVEGCWFVFFYPESNSFPWSLRSAAQSSDRQFFSNQVWRGNSKVHSWYDLMLPAHSTHRRHAQTRGQCCFVEGAIQNIFIQEEALNLFFSLCLISLLIGQRVVFGLRLNPERKPKSSVKVRWVSDKWIV